MITVKEVKTRKEKREFLNFPLDLYENNPYFVPPLYIDEKKIFRKDYVYYDTCDAVYYNAYKDGKIAGRISGILQKASNEKTGRKQIRFTRFDAIDDPEVSKALFEAVENWGRSLGMEEIIGPLGFSDLEREGLLIEGFDQLATFEEQYNAPYYARHIEALGYVKDVDWFESYIRPPKEDDPQLKKTAEYVMRRYHLRWGQAKSARDLIKHYKDQFFRLLDEAYDKLYGTVPFTENMKKMMIENFLLIIRKEYVCIIEDESGKVVCMAIAFPSLAKAVQKSRGHLTPACLVRVLRAIKHPEIIDFGLIGVDAAYLNKGLPAVIGDYLLRTMRERGVEHAETNLNLETNYAIRNLWKRADSHEHKKRRSYIKKLTE